MIWRQRFLILIIGHALVVLLFLLPLPANAGEDNAQDLPAVRPTASLPTASLPTVLPDRRAVRKIGLYQSQLDELVPKDFRPISIKQLLDGISQLASQSVVNHDERLNSAVYWIDVRDDLLVSDRSEIDFHLDSADQRRIALGHVNLAIDSPVILEPSDGSGNFPRLENSSNGELVAVFERGDQPQSKLQFNWQLRGQAAGSGFRFELRLPRTPQTRLVFSVPRDVSLETSDGVLRARSGPPPDADTFGSDAKRRWYELDAGGLSQIRFRTRGRTVPPPENRWIAHRHSIQYFADTGGIRWQSQWQMRADHDGAFPSFQIAQASCSKISINDYEVPFSTRTRGARKTIQIEHADTLGIADGELLTLTINGVLPLQSSTGWLALPLPYWDRRVEIAATVDQAQLIVPADLQLAKWELPHDWTQQPRESLPDGAILYAAFGPAPMLSLEPISNTQANPTQFNPRWSRIRLLQRTLASEYETALKLERDGDAWQAVARLMIKTSPDGFAPLRIGVQPDWSLDSISFPHSSRIIERPRLTRNGQICMLWPDAEDIQDGTLSLDLFGSRGIAPSESGAMIPATWFVAPYDFSSQRVVAVARPASWNWESNALLHPERMEATELSAMAADFFGILPSDTLLFRPLFDPSPPLSLSKPSASFAAAIQLYLLRDQEELTEQLEVDIESAGKPLPQISIQTDPSHDRPPLQWSLRDEQDPLLIRIPASAITVGQGEQAGLYTINLTDQRLRGQKLIGQRSSPAVDLQTITLPTIPAASLSRGRVWIGDGLAVADKPDQVQSILADPPPPLSLPSRQTTDRAATANAQPPHFSALRYDPAQPATITVATSDPQTDVAIVRRQRIRMVGSSRGVDRIEASYLLAPSSQPLRINFDPDLQLVSLTRNDAAVVLDPMLQDGITIAPHAATETVRVVWNRDQVENRWLRRFQVPQIVVSGIVLKSEYELVPAADAFAPASLLQPDSPANPQLRSLNLQPGDTVLLIRRNFVLASGWLAALLVFAMSWLLAIRQPLGLAAAVTIVVVGLLLWWPWKVAIIGWLLVPMIAAGMLATARAPSATRREDSSQSSSGEAERSADFSMQTLFRSIGCLAILAGSASAAANAQEAQASAATETESVDHSPVAVNVLVPLDRGGKQIGSTVYIHRQFYEQLTSPTSAPAVSDLSFQAAEYRVRIEQPTADSGSLDRQIVEAEYLIHIDAPARTGTSARLPLPAATVRRVELLGRQPRLLRFDPESANSVLLTLPPGNVFRIRVTMNVEIRRAGSWNQLTLAIPTVAASALFIESQFDLDKIRLGGAGGNLIRRVEPRRWVEPLGPQSQLIIEYPRRRADTNQTEKILQRRYLVAAGRRNAVIQCQLDPPAEMATGDTIEFIVLDPRQPRIVSPHWELQGSELLAAARRRITVLCNHDAPGTIDLLWTMPSGDPTSSTTEIPIPEITAAGSVQTAAAWIALQTDPSLQFAPQIGDDIESLSVDHFKTAWQAPLGNLDRTYVAVAGIRPVTVSVRPTVESTVHQQHHLHVTKDQLELRYRATLTPGAGTARLYGFRYPVQMKVQQLLCNGEPVPHQPVRDGDEFEICLPDVGELDSVTLEATATLPLQPSDRSPTELKFSLPKCELTAASATKDDYTVSRDPSIAVWRSDGTEVESVAVESSTATQWLRQGWAPVLSHPTSTSLDASNRDLASSPFPPATETFIVKSLDSPIDAALLISIDFRNQSWGMEAKIRFASDNIPDIIDVEIPNRWGEQLEVTGALQWLDLKTTDAARQIVRIRYDKQSVQNLGLTIRGQLRDNDAARLDAPLIQILGPGTRDTYVDVPQQLPSGDLIKWQTSGLEPGSLPSQWSDSKAVRAIYVASNPSWSIERFAPPNANAEPVAFLFDANVFAQPDGALVQCHWDFAPGAQNELEMRLFPGTKVLAAWCAGRAVKTVHTDPLSAAADDGNQIVRLPVAVNGLPQVMEVLLQVSSTAAQQGKYLPELVGIPSAVNWIVHQIPGSQSLLPTLPEFRLPFRRAADSSQSNLTGQRQFSLAQSVVQAVEATDQVVGRPRQEITLMLRQWQVRYHTIRGPSRADTANEPLANQWQDLETRLTSVLQRYDIDPTPDTSGTLSPGPSYRQTMLAPLEIQALDESLESGYRVQQIKQLGDPAAGDVIPIISAGDRGLNRLITSGLNVALVAGILICLIPWRRFVLPLTSHPAFWLLLMGLFGFAVAPVGVAGALILLAVALPVIPWKKPVSQTVD